MSLGKVESKHPGAGEMTQQVRALTALQRTGVQFPTSTGQLNNCNYRPGDRMPSTGLPGHCMHVYRHVRVKTPTHVIKQSSIVSWTGISNNKKESTQFNEQTTNINGAASPGFCFYYCVQLSLSQIFYTQASQSVG